MGGREGMALFVETDDFHRLNVGFALDEGQFVMLTSTLNVYSILHVNNLCNFAYVELKTVCSIFQVHICTNLECRVLIQ